jgi:hypothetical protein
VKSPPPASTARKRPTRKSAASPSLGQEGCCVSAMLLGDRLPDLGHQIVRNIHDGLGRLNAGFILRQCLVFGLFSVVGKDPLYLGPHPIRLEICSGSLTFLLSAPAIRRKRLPGKLVRRMLLKMLVHGGLRR